ncbi:hypothetical protein Tco_0750462 [Tanacetum coccineum]|uniref:Uncharacterized protein n=1 Tax=Tanacetum coccineum TaxID=301880 RepID=A0ABQ4Z2R5_9ASTR
MLTVPILSCQIQRISQSLTRQYPVHLEAPPSLDYVPGLEEPEQAPLSPELVPLPVYLEFMPPEDEVFSAEKDGKDPEEDPIDYPADGGDNDDESSDDDKDDDDDVEEDEDEEEEEHPALSDSILPPIHRVTARMSIREQPPTPFGPRQRLLDFLTYHHLHHHHSPYGHHHYLRFPHHHYQAGVSEVTLPPRKRLCIALGPRYEIRESRDTNEIYRRLDEAHDARAVLSGRLNLLQRNRRSHAYTTLIMEREDRLSCNAWGRSMDASDTTRSEVRALRTTVLA